MRWITPCSIRITIYLFIYGAHTHTWMNCLCLERKRTKRREESRKNILELWITFAIQRGCYFEHHHYFICMICLLHLDRLFIHSVISLSLCLSITLFLLSGSRPPSIFCGPNTYINCVFIREARTHINRIIFIWFAKTKWKIDKQFYSVLYKHK